MGCCYGVSTILWAWGGSGFACEMGYDPISLAWVSSFGKGSDPATGSQAKNPRRSEEFFVGAQERTRTSTVLPAST